MDNVKIGKLIYQLRKENRMTQLQLANQMNISDKAVSKLGKGTRLSGIITAARIIKNL